MSIKRFSFTDHTSGWQLGEVAFGPFNLLVGISGVGKSRILDALSAVKWAGMWNASYAQGCEWSVELELQGVGSYQWSAHTSTPEIEGAHYKIVNGSTQTTPLSIFLKENLVKDDGQELIFRDGNVFRFRNSELPKLKAEESALSLLANEPSIALVNQALQRILRTEARFLRQIDYDRAQLEFLRQSLSGLKKLQSATFAPMLARAYVLQEDYPDVFQRIIERYQEIFSTVETVRVGRASEFAASRVWNGNQTETEPLVIGIKEAGIRGWIVDRSLSHGMLQTLLFLIELELAPSETVFLVDEIEDGLGVNCLPQLMDLFFRRSQELQFVITSHHPYVINNIPTKFWKLVTRRGSNVHIIDADTIPELQTDSAHEKFILLVNSEMYEEGIR
jgi:predicted ATPase